MEHPLARIRGPVHDVRGRRRAVATVLVALAVVDTLSGCVRRPAAPPAITIRWNAGHAPPAFDPDGPPDPLRVALERALSRGLVECDSTGAVRFAAAETAWTGTDGRTLTLRLRSGLRFTDGTPATSDHFREALQGGLAREDHATRAWLLRSVEGMERVRAGRPLP